MGEIVHYRYTTRPIGPIIARVQGLEDAVCQCIVVLVVPRLSLLSDSIV